ncbi:MAG: hypothetical protein U9Q78_01865 [Chloroflexota bacterium]|nr:hypothetical protein [Chloroflexota bacterium]
MGKGHFLSKIGQISLTAASFLVQLAASTADWAEYYRKLSNRYPQPETGIWMDPARLSLSPILGQFRIWRPAHFDLLWWHMSSTGEVYLDWLLLASLAIVFALSILLLVSYMKKRGRIGRMALLSSASLIVGLGALLVQGPRSTKGYEGVDTETLRQIAGRINKDSDEAYIVATVSNEFEHSLVMNFLKGHFVHYWYSPAQEGEFDDILSSPIPARRLWLVVDRIHLQPDHSGQHLEWWLNKRAYRYEATWMGTGYQVFGYFLPRRPLSVRRMSCLWRDGIELVGFAQGAERVEAGDILPLQFHFLAREEMDRDYALFVHLLSPDGETIDGPDGEPLFGALPTSAWRTGQEILDRRALLIPKDLEPGEYQIEIGFYNSEGRLPMSEADGDRGDKIYVGEVHVEE